MANTVSNQSSDWFNYIAYDLWHEIGDPVSEVSQILTYKIITIEYFWLKGPWLTLLATFAYLYLVLKAGPDFMRDKKPYDLKLAIRLYNLILVAINAYLFVGSLFSFRYGLDFWGCGEALSTRKRRVMLDYGHMFFHTRYLEFFDTFFFILRKKNQQISFLHVFHHAIVPTLMYFGLKFYPLPYNSLLPMTNMFVHIIMYAYYGLATFGPWMQPYLWWKKPECKFPMKMIFVNFCIGVTFLTLFVSFYIQSYCKTDKGKRFKQASKNDDGCNGHRHNASKNGGTELWCAEKLTNLEKSTDLIAKLKQQ